MGLKVGELFATLSLDGKDFDKGLNQTETKANKWGGLMVGLAKKTAIGMVTAMGAFATGSIVKFAPFEEQMREVFTLLPGLSEKAMDSMTNDVKNFAKEFGVMPDKVVPALYSALSAGVPQDNVFSFLEKAQKGAKAGVAELETAVDALSSVVNTYGEDVIDAGKASDIIFTTIKGGKTTFNELAGSLYNVLPSASALGIGFDTVGASLATLTAQGTPTAQATTQLRSMFDELGKTGTKVDKVFREISGKSFSEFIASGGDVQGALTMLDKKAKDNNLSLKDLFSSVEAGNASLGLTGKGAQKFSDELKNMERSAGATDIAYETMTGTIMDRFNKIKASAVATALDFGEVLAPAVNGFLDLVLKGIPMVSDIVEKTFEIVRNTINSVIGTLAKSGTSVGSFKDMWINGFETIMGVVLPIVEFVKTKIMEAVSLIVSWWTENGAELLENVQIVFNGIWKIIEFIMPAILAIVSMVWENVKGVISGALNVISGVFKIFAGLFSGDWSKMWDGIKQLLSGALELLWNLWNLLFVGKLLGGIKTLGTNALGLFKNMWTGIQNGFGSFIQWIQSLLVNGVTTYVNIWRGLYNQVINIFNTLRAFGANIWTSLTTAIRTAVTNAYNSAINTFQSMVTGIRFRFDSILSSARSIFNSLKTAILNPVQSARDSILQIIDRIKNAFTNLKITIPKPKLPKINVGSKTVMGVPIPTFDLSWFKNGGLFNGPSVIGVGEAGPEAVVPLAGHRMRPFAQEIARQMDGGRDGGGGNYGPEYVVVKIDGKEIVRATRGGMDKAFGQKKIFTRRANGKGD